ncbi:Signal peptidase I S [Listeria grayi]|uniref:Signal peptidase I n=1 Tax=Listeria grayi FSL F6-1183 TaxID=1265827 RepID=A0A829R7T4_LISGR|nr:type I signal peptidase SipZ [Listeria grayi]EUJ27815.1 signal peptidase I [Listeria grayi FSL F6-1183]MBC1920903.1 type I signal peptidase SipZ [Listeria grayi]VEI34697.1 Signal peptidase I S [Listeria grayi]
MKEKNLKRLWSWIWAAVIAILLATIIRFYLFVPIFVDGISMMPSLHNDDRVIINRFANIDRFDVIVFRENDGTEYIKRVIGLPGDHIRFHNDTLFINGKKYEEPYLNRYKAKLKDGNLTDDYDTKNQLKNGKVAQGSYFVLGDNRRASKDSRILGEIPESKVIGRAIISYWPIQNVKIIK